MLLLFCSTSFLLVDLLLSFPQDGVSRFCSFASLGLLVDELVDLLLVGSLLSPFNDSDKVASVLSM